MLTTDSRRLETPPTSKSVEPQKLLQREGVFCLRKAQQRIGGKRMIDALSLLPSFAVVLKVISLKQNATSI
jgi:hypothetical protein